MDFLQSTVSILEQGTKYNPDRAWIEAVEAATPEILRLITKVQLGNEGQGIDGDGNTLGYYAPFTIDVRSSFGLQTDHISLEFSGEFLGNLDVIPSLNGWDIFKDEERYKKLTVELNFSDTILQLTEEHEKIIFPLLRQYYTDYVEAS